MRKKLLFIIFLNLRVRDNKISNINLVPYKFDKNGVNLVSKKHFRKSLKELNNYLPKSKKIWQEYLLRKIIRKLFFQKVYYIFIIFINLEMIISINIKTLSKKYIDLDFFKNNFKSDPKYKYLLDKWQINYSYNFLSVLKNMFNSIYMISIILKKILRNIKVLILK